MIRDMIIRLAAPEDAAELARLNDEFNGVGRSPAEIEESLRQSNEIVLIAFLRKRAVGFICGQYFRSFCYSELQGEITEMYVMREARGQRIGTSLIKKLEEELEKQGVQSIKVLTGNDNYNARRVYEQSFYELENEVILHKELKLW
ncbi:GNAT family N-acetyltransferase [Paenibacillus aquistagni]|uniref:GNAT family N-acetyltransferase n=1 Tax=Paenibacillus aquistagni TaxID=1852522 RepID=UPI00145AE911|nr:GNAT family N-acetyltransferase [Paenibacillus aquistagni]NMM53926.1 GNAT family N-acetyltransferase [Paenibacillus aquistagni]